MKAELTDVKVYVRSPWSIACQWSGSNAYWPSTSR